MSKTFKLSNEAAKSLLHLLHLVESETGDWRAALTDAVDTVEGIVEATEEPERVIFRKFAHNCEVIALLPDQYDARTGMIGSYLHNGQHGDTYPDFGDTVAADVYDYADLHAELVRVGYKNLKVVKRFGKLGK